MIPIDILQQGTQKIAEFLLDLFRSPETNPLYRSKLVVLGFEGVGKTAVLDCLFPLEGWLVSQGKLVKTSYWFKLQGNTLRKYDSPTDKEPHKKRTTVLENWQWDVSPTTKEFGIRVTPKPGQQAGQPPQKDQARDKVKEIEMHCPDRETQEIWLARLRRVSMNESTHGIETRSVLVDNQLTQEFLSPMTGEGEKKASLELSVWDFGGQHDYYSNHHFLSPRSVFLVLWKMNEGEKKGKKGLEFWFRALATYVTSASPTGAASEGRYFSVVVVGTFLDHPLVKREQREQRERMVKTLAEECGLATGGVLYFEVSSAGANIENTEAVYEAVVKSALGHSHMGERVPQSYLQLEQTIQRLREEKKKLPLVPLEELNKKVGDLALVKRALGLLSLWGECVYFESPAALSSYVILDPRFLAKGILADLFTSLRTIKGMKKDGKVKHSDLAHIWKRFRQEKMSQEEFFSTLCGIFVAFLEKLGVCYIADADRGKPFMDQRSIIPALLPERDLQDQLASILFTQVWPSEPPATTPVQVERVLKFRTIPSELVSRLFVHLHTYIQNDMVWKNEVVIKVPERDLERAQAWIRVEERECRFVIVLRGVELADCLGLLDYITGQIREVSICGGIKVSWEEKARSPYYSGGGELDLAETRAEAALPADQRKLLCPETLLPVHAERVLARAGLSSATQAQRPAAGAAASWWNFHSATVYSGSGDKGTLLVNVYEGGQVKNSELHRKLGVLFGGLGISLDGVEKVYGVNNPRLRSAFDIKREVIERQHQHNPAIFRREDWRMLEDGPLRRKMHLALSAKIRAFRGEFNDGVHSFVLPMIHGTSESAAYGVVEDGFGQITAKKEGYYGRGMYFTSDLRYANMNAKDVDSQGQPGVKIFMIALVLPGNAYPVAEHPFMLEKDREGKERWKRNPEGLIGQPCKPGYQSHYTIVDSASNSAYPVTFDDFDDPERRRVVSDMLVLFEGAQALPLFLVYHKTPCTTTSPSPTVDSPRKEALEDLPSSSSSTYLLGGVPSKSDVCLLVCLLGSSRLKYPLFPQNRGRRGHRA